VLDIHSLMQHLLRRLLGSLNHFLGLERELVEFHKRYPPSSV
jgi:hypothetical protein